jgi:hypothetical protein
MLLLLLADVLVPTMVSTPQPLDPSSIDSPLLGMLLDERLHELLALRILQIHDFDTITFEVLLTADEGIVLAHHDSGDFVQDACTRAHITRRECGVHGGAFI